MLPDCPSATVGSSLGLPGVKPRPVLLSWGNPADFGLLLAESKEESRVGSARCCPGNAVCEGRPEGFGVIPWGFGVQIPDLLQGWVLRGFGLLLAWEWKQG